MGCGREWTASPASGDKGPFLPFHFGREFARIRAEQRFCSLQKSNAASSLSLPLDFFDISGGWKRGVDVQVDVLFLGSLESERIGR